MMETRGTCRPAPACSIMTTYLSLQERPGFQGPLITHGLKEEQVPACMEFLRRKLDGHFRTR